MTATHLIGMKRRHQVARRIGRARAEAEQVERIHDDHAPLRRGRRRGESGIGEGIGRRTAGAVIHHHDGVGRRRDQSLVGQGLPAGEGGGDIGGAGESEHGIGRGALAADERPPVLQREHEERLGRPRHPRLRLGQLLKSLLDLGHERGAPVRSVHGLGDGLDPLRDSGRARFVRDADDRHARLLDQAQGIGRTCTLRGDDESRVEGQDALGAELADVADILLRLQRLFRKEAR